MKPKNDPSQRIFNYKTHDAIDVVTHEVMFTITYDGKIMNIREYKRTSNGNPYSRYIYTLVACKADAENKCRKLNEKFKTDKFAVKEIRI